MAVIRKNKQTNKKRKTKNKINKTQKNKKKYRGGIKQKNAELTSFQAIYKMINNPTAFISKLAYSSLKGFLFKLDVDPNPENSEFFRLNDSNTAFTVPVYSLVFKCAIVDVNETILTTPLKIKDKKYIKSTESIHDFSEEAKSQQDIYIETIASSGKPICLAVIDYSYFDIPSANKFLDLLLRKGSYDAKAVQMLTYIKNNLSGDRQLGMISMELADSNFVELVSLQEDASAIVAYNTSLNMAIAEILILFIKTRIINCDLHVGNVMTKDDGSRAFLIDFGRTLNFNKGNPENNVIKKYNAVRKSNFKKDYDEIKNIDITDLYVSSTNPLSNVITNMSNILKFIAYTDYAFNTSNFDMTGMDRPQMISFLQYLYGDTFSDDWANTPPDWTATDNTDNIYENVLRQFRLLTETPMTGRNLLSNAAIKKQIENGELFSMHDDITLYNRSADIFSYSRPLRSTPSYKKGPGVMPKNTEEVCDPNDDSCLNSLYKIFGRMNTNGGLISKK
jgi:hypothetical protein